MMNWIKAGGFALGGGVLALLVGSVAFGVTTGNCSVYNVIDAVIFCVPPANVCGVSLFRRVHLKEWTLSDIAGAPLGLAFSVAAAIAGLLLMESAAWLIAILFGTCLGGTLGYAMGAVVVTRSGRRKES